MKRAFRIILTVVVLSALIVAGIYVIPVVQAQQSSQQAADNEQAAQILDETTVSLGNLVVTVSGTGTVSPNRDSDLAFEVSSPVREVLVEEGQRVAQGDVLARLDVTDLQAVLQDAQVALESQRVAYNALIAPAREVDIAAAEAALNAARAAAGAASQGADAEEIEIARIQTELARNQVWQTQLQRDQTLNINPEFRDTDTNDAGAQVIQLESAINQQEQGVTISEVNYADVVNRGPNLTALSSANAQIVQAQVQLERLLEGPDDIELQQAEISLQQAELAIRQAQAMLDRAQIVAPFDGVVAQSNLVVGELPPDNLPALILIDDSSYYVDLNIDETDISGVAVNQPAELRFDALPGVQVQSTVTRVNVTQTNVGTLVTYTVRVTLDDTDAGVRTGMSATATIVVNQLDDVLVVPNRFIRIDRSTGQAFATIAREDGQFEEVPVELGLRNDQDVQIVSGLQAGQRLVLLPRASFNPFAN